MKNITNRIWGIFFLCSALLLIVGNLGVFHFYVPPVKIFFTLGFVCWLFASILQRKIGGILFSCAFLLILYHKEVGLPHLSPFPFLLGTGLAVLGIHMLSSHKQKVYDTSHMYQNTNGSQYSDEDVVNLQGNMNSSMKYIQSQSLKCCKIKVNMANMKVFFDKAEIKDTPAYIQFQANLSSVELYVPSHWRIKDETNTFLSGVESPYIPQSQNTMPTLILQGDVHLSGIKVIFL